MGVRPNGRVGSIRSNGMVINHGVHDGRTIISTRKGRAKNRRVELVKQ